MIRFFLPLLLIAAAVGGYLKFTTPVLSQIDELRLEREKLNVALDNAKKLRQAQDALLASYREIPESDLARLAKFLPDNVDNVRLIIDINNIAKQSGMSIKDLRIKTAEGQSESSVIDRQTSAGVLERGEVGLGFSVTGPYLNFQSFLRDLSRSLRLVDIEVAGFQATTELSDVYTYSVDIKTYWLK
jgi:Tfp pilus assembly protein PilO